MAQVKVKNNTEILIDRKKMRIWFPRGKGRCAYLDVPPELKGRVSVLRPKKRKVKAC